MFSFCFDGSFLLGRSFLYVGRIVLDGRESWCRTSDATIRDFSFGDFVGCFGGGVEVYG
jgi:hypothetical protein